MTLTWPLAFLIVTLAFLVAGGLLQHRGLGLPVRDQGVAIVPQHRVGARRQHDIG